MGELETIAELSITLAGFAGIVYVFSETDSGSDIRFWRIRNLLLIAFFTMLAALAPLGLPALGVAEELIPRIASGILALFLLFLAVLVPPSFFKLEVASRSRLGKPFFYAMLVLLSATLLVQILNMLGTFGSLSFGVFYFGLVLMLAAGSAQFMISILDVYQKGS